MAYDEKLASRIQKLLAKRKDITEKKMFGGIAFMLRGNMCCGVAKDMLMLRVGPEQFERLLREPHARPMDFTGRPLTGFLYVGPQGIRTDDALHKWVRRALNFVLTLPAK
jgi:TfoX/Sxy family transcriptional regulator of competence genes